MLAFGITGNASIGGDYDLWRSSAPGASAFQIRPSSDTASIWTVRFDQAADSPMASSRVR